MIWDPIFFDVMPLCCSFFCPYFKKIWKVHQIPMLVYHRMHCRNVQMHYVIPGPLARRRVTLKGRKGPAKVRETNVTPESENCRLVVYVCVYTKQKEGIPSREVPGGLILREQVWLTLDTYEIHVIRKVSLFKSDQIAKICLWTKSCPCRRRRG